MRRKKMNKRVSRQIFRNTATSEKSINLTKKPLRGGIRL